MGTLLTSFEKYLRQLIGSPGAGEVVDGRWGSDVVQEAYLKAVGQFAQFRGSTEAEFVGWLARILRNDLASAVRAGHAAKRGSGRRVSLDAGGAWGEQLADPSPSPAELASAREEAAIVGWLIAQLPAPQQMVLHLQRVEGLSFEEAGVRMDCTAAAARMTRRRAVMLLGGLAQALPEGTIPGF